MLKSIEHAKLYTSITRQQRYIILDARKSLLFSKEKPQEKTINESLFDITMGSYDGAKFCELVSLYILLILGKVHGIRNVGLHREDGLACLYQISGPASHKLRKYITRTFRENFGLKITITTNLKIVNFLDLHSIYAPQDTNLIRNRTAQPPISMPTQTIHPISSQHYQITFKNE